MNWPVPSGDDHSTRLPALAALGGYLRGSGWTLVDEDARTSMWRLLWALLGLTCSIILPKGEAAILPGL